MFHMSMHSPNTVILTCIHKHYYTLPNTTLHYTHTHETVEHYHKKQSIFIDEECKVNEVRVSSSGKPQDIATKVSHIMMVRQSTLDSNNTDIQYPQSGLILEVLTPNMYVMCSHSQAKVGR